MITMKNIFDYADINPGQRKFIEDYTAIKSNSPHEIKCHVKSNGDIVRCFCSCKAGLGEMCKHIIATLLSTYCIFISDSLEILSCTDNKCEWKKDHSKSLKKFNAAPLMQHSCFAEPTKTKKIINSSTINSSYEHEKLVHQVHIEEKIQKSVQENLGDIVAIEKKQKCVPERELSQSELNEITSSIITNLPMSAIAKHKFGRHEPIVFKKKNKISLLEKEVIKTIYENQDNVLMQHIQKFEVPIVKECCVKTMNKLSENLESITENTKLYYAQWLRERQYRITGSVCYGLYTYSKNVRSEMEWITKLKSTFEPKNVKTAAMEYGTKNESAARSVFTNAAEKVKYKVMELGLIVSKLNPWLAYSPDGVVLKDNKPIAVLEIKCPVIGAAKGIKETIDNLLTNKKSCLDQKEENIVLKPKHTYYGQVQLGMAVLNVNVAYFVIYSTFDKQIFYLRVPKDDAFITAMLTALKKVFITFRLHELCDKKETCESKNDN